MVSTTCTPSVFAFGTSQYTASTFAIPVQLAYQGGPSLVTVIELDSEQTVSENFLAKVIQEYERIDDVFRPEFLQGVIFTARSGTNRADSISPGAAALLESYRNEWFEILDDQSLHGLPPAGVYFASDRALFEVYRLYEDTHGAFLSALMRAPGDDHVPLNLVSLMPTANLVGVPTRIRTKSQSWNPLQGLRVVVKGNFHIRGIRTSACSRAYLDTYPAQKTTAKSISKLESGGARVVGVAKLAAFAATEEPIECVDYQAPWNPRGDGHQSPAGSSSGSGSAVAAYEWLDMAIGTDTSGSGRRPAHWNGCFAHRPTHGLVDLEGILPSFSQFDTATLFARDVAQCKEVVDAWYGDKLPRNSSDLPFKVIVPEDYIQLITNPDQLKLINEFVKDLQILLGVRTERVSLEDMWNDSPPEEASGLAFADYMEYAARDAFFYDDYHNLDTFRSDYFNKFSKTPYVSPPLRWQWNLSATITRRARDEAVNRLAVYRNWFLDTVMEADRKRSIMIIPIENITPRYRDEAKTSFDPRGVPMLFLSPISGGPETTVPIGQVQYMSRVTNRLEPQPVAVSLLSPPGTDLELLRLVADCLERSGRPTTVLVGRSTF